MSPSTASRAASHTRPNPSGLPLALCFALGALLAGGCSSRAPDTLDAAPTVDAGSDVATTDAPAPMDIATTDAPADAGSPCTSDRQCSALGGVCDRDRGVCVACRTRADCTTAGTACIAQRCVAVTPCTTSRACPGQVCNTTLGYCVDCNADGDCTSTQRCQDNSCVARPRPCTSSRQCSDLALVCDTAQSICVECVADADCDVATQFCAAGGRCAARVCTPAAARCTAAGGREVCNARGTSYDPVPCSATQSCRDGSCVDRVCVPGARRCPAGSAATYETCNVDGLAYTATPCPGGQSCAGGACVMQSCTPGARRCVGPTSLQTCNADGLGFGATTACPAGNGCNATTNACAPYTCTPGAALACAGASARVVCNADGQGTSTVPCGSTESCQDGACRPRICAPGTPRCVAGNSARFETCTPDGLSYAPTDCAPGTACSGGVCIRQVCTPGTPSCVTGSNATQTCTADGLGYTAVTACPGGTTCTASTGRCGAWICTPGVANCIGNTRQVCNADGLTYTTTTCGSRETCSAGVCAVWVCTPGEFSCADVNTRRQCNADGLGYTAAPCSTRNACLGAGVCTPWIAGCTPGVPGAVCASATAQQVCSADGQGFVSAPCAAGQSCSGGLCAVRCGDGIVGSGETCDDGNTVNGDGCSSTCQSDRCTSLDLSGGGYASVLAAADLDVGTSWTVAFWARPTNIMADAAIWTNQISGSDCGSIDVQTYAVDGIRYFASAAPVCGYPRLTGGAGALGFVSTGQWMPSATWSHVAIVVNVTTATTYLNGGVVHTTAVNSVDPYRSSNPFRIGTDGVHNFTGQIFDLAMWNRALGAAEIATVRASNVRALGADASLLVNLRADEGTGTTLADSSGRGHPGTLQGAARWSTSCPSATSSRTPPTSCAAILAASPGSLSGTYAIDPDGAGSEPETTVYCDMTTMGGGWTLVFVPTASNYSLSSVGYTMPSAVLRTRASEALLAYRDTTALANAVSPVRFALPSRWRSASPMSDGGTSETVTWTAPTASGSATLHYGYRNWGGSTCTGVFSATLPVFGRVCLENVATAPFYSAFATNGADAGDYCSLSTQAYGTTNCSTSRAFTIAVR